jgi:hypothetical protein
VVQLNAGKIRKGKKRTYDPGCIVTIPLNPNSRFPKGYNLMFGEEENPQWISDPQTGMVRAYYKWKIGKIGIDSPAGWIAFSNTSRGYSFVEMFDYEPGGEYPDDGATVECWTVGEGIVEGLDYSESGIYLMETEVLSTLRDIKPGKSTRFKIEWGACRCPGLISAVSEGGCFSKPLTAVRQDSLVKLEAELGVFDVGTLLLWWINDTGERIKSEDISKVSPLEEVVLNHRFTPPQNASAVELGVIREFDREINLLANERVK